MPLHRPDNTQDKGDLSMSANTSFAASAPGGAELAFGGSARGASFDAAVAAELLRQRIGGSGNHALAHPAAVETPRQVTQAQSEPRREVPPHLVTRAYSQLISGD